MFLNKYDDFLLDLLFENQKVSELPFAISERLINILKDIKHPIAKELIGLNEERSDMKFTIIDIDTEEFSPDDDIDVIYKRFSFVPANKLYDNILKKYPTITYDKIKSQLKTGTIDGYSADWWIKSRTPVKIGSLITKLFGDKYKQAGDSGNDIESFINSIYAFRNRINGSIDEFELVDGLNIEHWYLEQNYLDVKYTDSINTLAGSCMKYAHCQDYIEFYSQSDDVQLLILKDSIEKDKIIGRALVWKLETPSGRFFMDRVYFTHENYVELLYNCC